MDIFNHTIHELRSFIQQRSCRSKMAAMDASWPSGGTGNIVIGEDVGLELGSPETASLSSLIWTQKPDLVIDDAITLIGKDMGESPTDHLPFAKIILVETEGFDEDNTYGRYRQMEGIRYDVNLKGYMIRAVSKTRKEWCRISKEALGNGFSLFILGAVLIEKLKQIPYIKKAEVVYVTSCVDDVITLKSITDQATRVITAMNKMVNEMALDCGDCDYNDVCSEVEMLQGMRKKLQVTHVG